MSARRRTRQEENVRTCGAKGWKVEWKRSEARSTHQSSMFLFFSILHDIIGKRSFRQGGGVRRDEIGFPHGTGRTVGVGSVAPALVAKHGEELGHDVALLLVDAHLLAGSSSHHTKQIYTHDIIKAGGERKKKVKRSTGEIKVYCTVKVHREGLRKKE